MGNLATLKTGRDSETDEWQLRVDLAAAFRLSVMFDWHEAVANHLSLAVSADGKKFLMNPRWRHFSRIRASDLMLLDAEDPPPWSARTRRMSLPGRSMAACMPPCRRRAASFICIPPYATTLATLANPEILPIDQNTARFYNRIAFDMDYGGMANYRRRRRPPWPSARQQADHDDGQSRCAGLCRHRGRSLRSHLLSRARLPHHDPCLFDGPEAARSCHRHVAEKDRPGMGIRP